MIADANPQTYARHLAGYISDPSTIRVRVLEHFGEAPDIEKIRRYRSEVERLNARQWNTYQAEKWDFKFPEPRKVEAKEPEAPVFDAPPWKLSGACVNELIGDIARSFGLTGEQILGKDRRRYIVWVRHLVAVLLFERGNSESQVGRWLGDREHSTISNSRKVLPTILRRHKPIADAYAYYRKEWGLDK